jgi:long-chain fatty acid transport protein
LIWASPVWGSGFALYEGSARGNALGGGLVGRADDPSALFFNPAGITQLPGLQMMAGATAVMPSTDISGTNVYDGKTTKDDSEFNAAFPPHLYASYQALDKLWLGLGIFSRFGLLSEFDDEWFGRYNSHHAEVLSSSINPNVAFKLTDDLSVAMGFSAMWFDIKLEQKIDGTGVFLQSGQGRVLEALGVPANINDPRTDALDINQELNADDFGYGLNIALHYKPFDWMAAGFSYRSQVRQNLEGDADFTKSALFSSIPGTAALFNDTDASGSITLPDMYFAGLAFYPLDRLSLELGVVHTKWSTYDALTIKYENPIIDVPGGPGPVIAVVSKEKNWNDVWRYNFGAEYRALDWLDLRFAYVFDESPVPDDTVDYLVPADDRHLYNFGLGLHFNELGLDLSYTYLDIEDRSVSQRQIQDGVLESELENGEAHLIGLSLSYRF